MTEEIYQFALSAIQFNETPSLPALSSVECVVCGCDRMHIGKIEVLQKDQLTEINYLSPKCSYGHPEKLRGTAVVIRHDCEDCGKHTTAVVLAFHKGATYFAVRPIEEAEPSSARLWRD